MKRIFLIVLDSCGAGEMPDAAKFGDFGVNTLKSCSTSSKLHIPTMVHCGLGNIEGLSFLGTDPAQTGACARMAEASMGKDTTIGHWEIAGVVSLQLLQRDDVLVRRDLEHGVCGRINDEVSRAHMLRAVLCDDLGAGPGSVRQNAAARRLAEGLEHFLGEAVGIGGQRIRGNDARDLPVADRGVLARAARRDHA